MGLLTSLFLGFAGALCFAAILYWLDRYEKEPLVLLGGVFLWGAVIASGSAFIINTVLGLGFYIFTGSEAITELSTSSLIAPMVEETLKGLAVLLVFLVFRREFDSILDGIIYAGVTALGFAASENAYYIWNYGYQEQGWQGLIRLTWIRIGLVGWQHPFYTAFTGIGLALARTRRSLPVKILAPLTGLGLAMGTHAFHNTVASLVNSEWIVAFLDWSGWLFMFGVILFATYQEQGYLQQHLQSEVAAGLLTVQQYHIASSAWRQLVARLRALFTGRFFQTNRFYQLCGELAHKKQQLATLGDESGNAFIIQRLRAELARLSPIILNNVLADSATPEKSQHPGPRETKT